MSNNSGSNNILSDDDLSDLESIPDIDVHATISSHNYDLDIGINNDSNNYNNNDEIRPDVDVHSDNNLSLTDQFYLNTTISEPLSESLSEKETLSQAISKLFKKTFTDSLEAFYNYQVPKEVNSLDIGINAIHTTDNPYLGPSNNITKVCDTICDAKKTIIRDYQNLLEAEGKLLEMINDLDTMQTLSEQLNGFYSILDNRDIIDRFRLITLDAYKDKLNNCDFQDKLYIYRHMLTKHRKNLGALKDINLLNNLSNCPLCFQNCIDHVVLPCGHTFCKPCLDRCKSCGVCRGPITRVQRIYII